jgi:hypothetical protein
VVSGTPGLGVLAVDDDDEEDIDLDAWPPKKPDKKAKKPGAEDPTGDVVKGRKNKATEEEAEVKPRKKKRGDAEEEDEEEEVKPPKKKAKEPVKELDEEALPQGDPTMAGVGAGSAAVASLCLPGAPIAFCLGPWSALPMVGWGPMLVAGLSFPFVFGTVAAAAGWLAASLVGQKRVPLVPLWLSGFLGGCVGSVLSPLCMVPAVGGVFSLLMTATTINGMAGDSGDSSCMALGGTVALGCYAAAPACFLLGSGISALATSASFAGGGIGVGVLSALLGRGIADGEESMNLDLLEVPPPLGDEEED